MARCPYICVAKCPCKSMRGLRPSTCVAKTQWGYFPGIVQVFVLLKICVAIVHAHVWLCNASWEFTRALIGLNITNELAGLEGY